ncbi:MAG: hypothetical protein QHC90_07845 [Shinella sp.]|nr:hypothetical protein [Shinella sp.]
MVGRKTHEQQLRVLERREKTSGADKDFDAKEELQRSEVARDAYRKGQNLQPPADDEERAEDRSMLRGKNQESAHRKGAGN